MLLAVMSLLVAVAALGLVSVLLAVHVRLDAHLLVVVRLGRRVRALVARFSCNNRSLYGIAAFEFHF